MADYTYLSDINSFPTTKMESVNKLITENSLTRLINRLLDIDGYIISDGLAKANPEGPEIIGNGGKHLKINSDLNIDQILFKDNLFEFVIRGYYFSTDFNNLTSLLSEYMRTYSGDDTIGLYARIFIDNTNTDYPELVGQTAYESNADEFYGVQFFINPVNSQMPSPAHPSLPTDSETNIIEGLGTNYLYFDLLLLAAVKPDGSTSIYIPFESLCKFDSHSVDIIDGGVIDLSIPELNL